jgi:hypothetical protein
MYLKPSLSISRPILDEETSFRETGGNIALLRCLVWLHIHASLQLERVRFFANGNGYLLLAGRGGKYLISSNRGSLSLEAGRGRDIRALYSGEDEEEILRKITESEYGIL